MLAMARMVMTSFAIARVRQTAESIAAYAIALAAAGVIVLVALGFFLSAGWIALARAFDPLVASLLMGGVLVLIALIIWAIGKARRSRVKRPRIPAARPVTVLPVAAAPSSTSTTLLTAAAMVAGAGYVAGRVLTSGRRR